MGKIWCYGRKSTQRNDTQQIIEITEAAKLIDESEGFKNWQVLIDTNNNARNQYVTKIFEEVIMLPENIKNFKPHVIKRINNDIPKLLKEIDDELIYPVCLYNQGYKSNTVETFDNDSMHEKYVDMKKQMSEFRDNPKDEVFILRGF